MATSESSTHAQTTRVFPLRIPLTSLVTLMATLGFAGCGSSGAPSSSGDPDASVSSPVKRPATLKSSDAALRTIDALRTQFQLDPPKKLAHDLSPRHPAVPALYHRALTGTCAHVYRERISFLNSLTGHISHPPTAVTVLVGGTWHHVEGR